MKSNFIGCKLHVISFLCFKNKIRPGYNHTKFRTGQNNSRENLLQPAVINSEEDNKTNVNGGGNK